MSKQTPISMYFRSVSSPNLHSKKTTENNTSTAKRKLSLDKTSKKTAKMKCKMVSQLTTEPIECISLLSSSDDDTISGNAKTKKDTHVDKSNFSNYDSDTDEYSWTIGSNPATPQKETPTKKIVTKSPSLPVIPNITIEHSSNELKTPKSSLCPQNTSSPNGLTVVLQSPKVLQNNNSGNSPNKSNKYFSASKKRSVTKVHKSYTLSRQSLDGSVKKLFHEINTDCENVELDDKTQFFYNIVKKFLDDTFIHYLLSVSELNILERFINLKAKEAFMLICRMYWRKHKWYTEAECRNICETLSSELLSRLVAEEILIVESGSHGMMSLDDYLHDVLKSGDVKKLCKYFKLNGKTKKSAVSLLQTFCSRTPTISHCFRKEGTDAASSIQGGNLKRVLKKMGEMAGTCYKLSDFCKDTLYKLILISHLGINYEVIREKRLELMLLYVKNRQETFPTENCEIDKVTCVFPSRISLDNYMKAHYLYEKFLTLSPTDSEERKTIVLEAFSKYTLIADEWDIHAKSPWLRTYTAQNLYIKIVEQGIMELKKGKDEFLCKSAAQMMATLLQQASHRSHRRAAWADEQAKILHKYLQQPALAAEILIEALKSDIPDESKDLLRSRAKTIACQKNIELEESVRERLLDVAHKECISEKSLPHCSVYQQPMENVTKGKVQYKIKGNNGYEVLRVENVAIDIYKSNGEFIEGHHWEGKMITTQFFLLFWDIIYTKPKNTLGIFLCPYQMFPLDLFMSTFYSNRAEEIDERIKYLKRKDIGTIISHMEKVWKERPTGELSGVQVNLQWKHIMEVSQCMGAAGLVAVCERLARDYHYAHSGFPDLTVWKSTTKKIKFVEVKSDSDKPSMKQLQWIQYLLEHGLKAEFCYVGTK